MTPEEFRKHGHDMVDWIAEFLEHGVAEQREARRAVVALARLRVGGAARGRRRGRGW